MPQRLVRSVLSDAFQLLIAPARVVARLQCNTSALTGPALLTPQAKRGAKGRTGQPPGATPTEVEAMSELRLIGDDIVQIPTTPVKPSSPQKVLTVGELVLQRAASITGGSPLKKEN